MILLLKLVKDCNRLLEGGVADSASAHCHVSLTVPARELIYKEKTLEMSNGRPTLQIYIHYILSVEQC